MRFPPSLELFLASPLAVTPCRCKHRNFCPRRFAGELGHGVHLVHEPSGALLLGSSSRLVSVCLSPSAGMLQKLIGRSPVSITAASPVATLPCEAGSAHSRVLRGAMGAPCVYGEGRHSTESCCCPSGRCNGKRISYKVCLPYPSKIKIPSN